MSQDGLTPAEQLEQVRKLALGAHGRAGYPLAATARGTEPQNGIVIVEGAL